MVGESRNLHGCCADKACTDATCMELPAGKTCGDCTHERRCVLMCGHTATDTYCDWFPRRFREKTPNAVLGVLRREGDMMECHKLDNDKQVFFYEQDFYVLSNFSAFTLQWSGMRFDTSEAAYHWEKFKGTDCDDLRARIRLAPSAHEAFKIAEANKMYRRPDWDDVKLGVMRAILRAKVQQHEYVRRKLLATNDRELIEDSWRDDFWGWGPNRDGRNMLGRLWMEVRAELRADMTPNAGGNAT